MTIFFTTFRYYEGLNNNKATIPFQNSHTNIITFNFSCFEISQVAESQNETKRGEMNSKVYLLLFLFGRWCVFTSFSAIVNTPEISHIHNKSLRVGLHHHHHNDTSNGLANVTTNISNVNNSMSKENDTLNLPSTTSIIPISFNITNTTNTFPLMGNNTLNSTMPIAVMNKTDDHVNSDPSQTRLHVGHMTSHACGMKDPESGNLRPFRILMSSTDKYVNVILNWLIFYHQLCPDRSSLYFLCLDKTTELMMTKYGLQCSYVFHSSMNKNKLWLMRMRLTKQLLDQGFDVLMSDSDAVWLRNPFEYMEKFNTSDIVSSRASFPEDVSKRFGATLCMGFIYIKTNPQTKAMWGELNSVMSTDPRPDDQRSLNKVLMSKGLQFKKHLDYLHTTEGDTGTLNYKNNPNMQVTLLPHEQFRRVCEGFKLSEIHDSYVAHCLLDKTGDAKEKGGKRYKLWALKDNWEQHYLVPNETRRSVDEFLHDISNLDQSATGRLRVRHRRRQLHDPLSLKREEGGGGGVGGGMQWIKEMENENDKERKEQEDDIIARAYTNNMIRYGKLFIPQNASFSEIVEFERIVSQQL